MRVVLIKDHGRLGDAADYLPLPGAFALQEANRGALSHSLDATKRYQTAACSHWHHAAASRREMQQSAAMNDFESLVRAPGKPWTTQPLTDVERST